MRELAAVAARELARGSGSPSRAGIAGPAPGRRWPSSPDLRLSLAQRPALRLQLAPGGEPGRLRPLALPPPHAGPAPGGRERAWQDDTWPTRMLESAVRDRGTRSALRQTASADSKPQS